MKNIGEIFKLARVGRKLSLQDLEDKTKIKKGFIKALEEEKWSELPEYPVVLGFVKNISDFVGINKDKALAMLRRDYPPKILSINPKPDVSKEFVWSPKLTFLLGISLVALMALSYLGLQYKKFISPPELRLDLPKEEQVVKTDNLDVKGKTDADATITVNNQPVVTDEDGNFSLELPISSQTKEVLVIAKSRAGKETVLKRKIIPQLN